MEHGNHSGDSDSEATVASAAQDQWVDITVAIRCHLAKLVRDLPAMKPEEINQLVTAVDNAMWNEVKANAFDEQIQERKRSLERQAEFGG